MAEPMRAMFKYALPKAKAASAGASAAMVADGQPMTGGGARVRRRRAGIWSQQNQQQHTAANVGVKQLLG